MTTQRVPLDDICTGPRCRFFKQKSAFGYVPIIWYFYDKVETRTAKRSHYKEVGWLFKKDKRVEEIKELPHYHIVYIVYDPVPGNESFCVAFQFGISSGARYMKAVDTWNSEWSVTSNAHTFLPVDKLDDSYKPQSIQWQDGSKCPSFLPYPIKEAKK